MACACSMKSSWLPDSQPFPTPAKLRGSSCLRAHLIGLSCEQGSHGCPSTLPKPFLSLGPYYSRGPFLIQGLESTFLSKLADLIWNLKRLYYVLGSQTLLQLAPEVLPWGLDHLIQGLLLQFSPGLYPWASRRSNRVHIHLPLHLRVSIRLFITSESQLSTFLSTVLSWPVGLLSLGTPRPLDSWSPNNRFSTLHISSKYFKYLLLSISNLSGPCRILNISISLCTQGTDGTTLSGSGMEGRGHISGKGTQEKKIFFHFPQERGNTKLQIPCATQWAIHTKELSFHTYTTAPMDGILQLTLHHVALSRPQKTDPLINGSIPWRQGLWFCKQKRLFGSGDDVQFSDILLSGSETFIIMCISLSLLDTHTWLK